MGDGQREPGHHRGNQVAISLHWCSIQSYAHDALARLSSKLWRPRATPMLALTYHCMPLPKTFVLLHPYVKTNKKYSWQE